MKRNRSSAPGVSFFAFQDIITSVVGIFVLITLIMVLELAQSVAEAKANSTPVVSAELVDSLAILQNEVSQLEAEHDKLRSSANSSASTNRFNRDEQLAEIEARLRQLEDRINRANQITQETQRSLVVAQKVSVKMINESKAAESERHELQDLQSKRREVERYSSVLDIDKPLVFRETTQENRWLVLIQLVDGAIQIADSADGSLQKCFGPNRIAEFKKWVASQDLSVRHFLLIIKPTGAEDFKDVQDTLRKASATYGYDVAAEDANFVLRSEMNVGS